MSWGGAAGIRLRFAEERLFSLFKKAATAGLTAIDISARGLTVVRASRAAGRRPQISVCEYRPFSDAEPRDRVVARAASEYDLKRVRCTTTLDGAEYKLLVTEAPDVPADELKAAVRWRVKDLIDFHINDATIDVFDLPGGGPAKTRSMYAVVARNDAIKRRVDLLTNAGVNLDVIDIPELAQRNVAALLPEDAAGVVFLALRERDGLITVSKQGEIYLTRNLDVGLDAFAHADIVAQYDRIALEVQRSLDYFDSHFRQAPIAHLAIAPAEGEVHGLVEYLNGNLNVRAASVDLTQLVEFERPVDRATQARCLTTLGAALREESVAL